MKRLAQHISVFLLLLVGCAFVLADNPPKRVDLASVEAMDLERNRSVVISAYILNTGWKNGQNSPVIKISERLGKRLSPIGSLFKIDAQQAFYKANKAGKKEYVIWEKEKKAEGYHAKASVILKDGTPTEIKLFLLAPGQKEAKTKTCPYPWKH
ncbi:hypothetical protein SCOR_06210 [Sulfidibacter corallicola]|uniref:DUF4426 domain-containing protein n=1 Tax=Sulfidibacter corallicola TaxID=2818388 RepID=A0A8A4TQD8_SULCO|nr:hypothetical protein [Sulfidibacter corallicola]QTD51637.1 hypothetical protein J3U87_04135 [Sulfidibacter corallicola]